MKFLQLKKKCLHLVVFLYSFKFIVELFSIIMKKYLKQKNLGLYDVKDIKHRKNNNCFKGKLLKIILK